jgi:hypothetical protein
MKKWLCYYPLLLLLLVRQHLTPFVAQQQLGAIWMEACSGSSNSSGESFIVCKKVSSTHREKQSHASHHPSACSSNAVACSSQLLASAEMLRLPTLLLAVIL